MVSTTKLEALYTFQTVWHYLAPLFTYKETVYIKIALRVLAD